MARDVTQDLVNPQEMEAVVSGPDGANRLYVCSGAVQAVLAAQGGRSAKETFVFTIGPALTRRQIIRAIATAALASYEIDVVGSPAQGPGGKCSILDVDADWDDESDRVQVRLEVGVGSSSGVAVASGLFSYHVTILAEV